MRAKTAGLTIAGALAVTGVGYAAGVNTEAAAADAESESERTGHSMMGTHRASMMDGEHAEMMRDPAMREMHETMVREHAKMMRDRGMRRQHERAMREFPEMARMMREHMED